MRKPTIKRGPASHYAGADEAIAEFGDGRSGGLISVRRNADDQLVVDVYRTDDDVIVRSEADDGRMPLRADLIDRRLAYLEGLGADGHETDERDLTEMAALRSLRTINKKE